MVKTFNPRYALPALTNFSQIEMRKLYARSARKRRKKSILLNISVFRDGSNLRKDLEKKKRFFFFRAVLLPNQYFTPSDAFISKLEDTIKVALQATVWKL